ncbi:MAG: TonB-dependent receptor [Cytophagales bacterium]|nr:MAG: TonB-dependent receptor [Cytophagales bacterium]
MYFRITICKSVLFLSVFQYDVTLAQSQGKDSLNIFQEIVVKAPAKSEQDIGKTLNYEVLNAEYLTRNQGNTFVNSLERLPGISAINVGVGISKPVIRGLSLNRVMVNEYGIKQEGQQWGSDHGIEIDQYNVDRVEVVKGPVSVLYGSDGIGGVINIYPSLLPQRNTINGDFLMNYKSNNDLFGSSIKLQVNRNDVYAIARCTFQDYASYRVPANEFTYNGYVLPIYNQRLKNTAGNEINFSILTGIQRKWGFSRVLFSNFNQHAGFFVGAFGVPRAYQLFDDKKPRNIDLPNQNINHFKIVSNTFFAFNKNYLEIDLGYQSNTREEYSRPHAHGTADTSFGNLALRLILNTYTANLKFTHLIKKKKKNIYGINTQYQANQKSGHEFLIPDFKTNALGIFVFSEHKPKAHFIISGGLRLDYAAQKSASYFRSIYDGQLNFLKHEQVAPSLDRNYISSSGSIGSSYLFKEFWKLKTNLGSAFRVPVIAELAANGVHHGTFRHEQGDSTLSPERGYMLDVGLYYKKKKIEIDFTPFFNYFSNYIYLSPSARFSPLPDAGQIYKYKASTAFFGGFESNINYNLNQYVSNEISIEYVWNKNLMSGLPLPFTPPFSVLNEIKIHPFQTKQLKDFSCDIIGQYFSAQRRVDRNEPTTDAYFLLHFSLSNTFCMGKTKLNFYFQIRNVANTRYMNNMSRYRLLNLPEQGRNFQVLLKYSF